VVVSVNKSKRNGLKVYISPRIYVYEPLANSISSYLGTLGFVVSIMKKMKTSKGYDLYEIMVNKKSVLAFREWLYAGSTIHLTRKYDKFDSDGTGYKAILV